MDDPALLPAATAALFVRLSRAIDTARREEAERSGLTPAQVDALQFAAEVRPDVATVGQLARVLGVRHPTAVGILRPLLDRGLLARTAHPYDRRQRTLTLTAAGREVLTRVDAATPTLAATLADLPRSELEALAAGLKGVARAMQASGVLVVPAPCRGCLYFEPDAGVVPAPHRCRLIGRYLSEQESRMKCPEHTPAARPA